jgi:hypothetical protein
MVDAGDPCAFPEDEEPIPFPLPTANAAAFEVAMRGARQDRDRFLAVTPPHYAGCSKAQAMAFNAGPWAAWANPRIGALHDLAVSYADAFRVADASGQVAALSEFAELEVRAIDQLHAALALPLPREFVPAVHRCVDHKLANLWHEARQVASKCVTTARASRLVGVQVDGCAAVLHRYDGVVHAPR